MCPDEPKLLKLLAGELPTVDRDAVLAHLATCVACRDTYSSMQATWDQLGQWQPSAPPRDLTGAILAAASRQSTRSRWYLRTGIAAAILLAASAGYTAGRWPLHPSRPTQPISTEEMAQKVGLDALGGDLGAFENVFSLDQDQDSPVQGGQS